MAITPLDLSQLPGSGIEGFLERNGYRNLRDYFLRTGKGLDQFLKEHGLKDVINKLERDIASEALSNLPLQSSQKEILDERNKHQKRILDYIKEKLRENEDDLSSLSWLAEFYEHTDNTKKAKSIYNRISTLYPGNARALVQLGRLYKEEGELEKAEQSLRIAGRIEPHRGAYDLLELYLIQGKHHEADSLAKQLLPTDHFAFIHIGQTYFNAARYETALPLLERTFEEMSKPQYQSDHSTQSSDLRPLIIAHYECENNTTVKKLMKKARQSSRKEDMVLVDVMNLLDKVSLVR
ncbi:MAG: tetratricopeptide repeat protein [Candidatus Nanoarchaeia archaeon]